jgi:DHA2 family multidrug resistance protein
MSDTPVSLKSAHGWYIITAIMLSTIMEILDTTIVNVSLPHMMGSLSADRDQISWVLTSYIVAAGVLMPLTGFLVGRFGSKRLMLLNVSGFMFASALCGVSTNLTEIVIFRLLQGIFGASLMPLSQFILRDTFAVEDQPKVMAIWGIGVMAAPIMGPTLGGMITDSLNWRWIFYINVPICILDFFLVLAFIKQSTLRKDVIDWLGMGLMITSIAALQLFLDRGEVDDWFSSPTICWLAIIFVVTFVLFLVHSFTAKNPIINLRLFKERTFGVGTMMMSFFAASFFGCIALIPQMQETLFGYSSDLSGLSMAPRGIASAMMMAVVSRLMMKGVDPRFLIGTGLMIAGYSTYLMSDMTLDTNMQFIIILGFVQGLGIGAFFMPLSAIVYSGLPRTSIAEASGLFSFGRNIGNAIGISILTTIMDRGAQTNWNILGGHIQASNPNLRQWLSSQNLQLNDPHTIARLGNDLSTQATFISYVHTYRLASFVLLAAFFMAFLLKKPPRRNPKLAAEPAH